MYKIAQGCSKIPDHLGNVKISFNLKKMLLKVKLENDQKTMKVEKKSRGVPEVMMNPVQVHATAQ